MRTALMIMLTLSLFAVGCGGEQNEPGGTDETDTVDEPIVDENTEADEQADEQAAAEPTAEEFPLPEDFEEEAATRITPNNLEQELAALEAELDAEEAQ